MSGDQPRFKEAPPELRSDDDEPADAAAPVVITRDSPSPSDSPPPSENRVGNYLLDQLIAHGSSGDVWKAAAPDGSIVAVKIFKKELAANADALQRFNHEAKLLRRVSHPNLVALIDSGETADHVPFIVMEYIEGQTVKERLENESAFEPTAVAKIGREICRALSAAHAETIIHRDLKPSNIILTGDNDARIIDFGIAKAIGYTGETLTQLGGVVGTPAYMSPEQCLGSGIDERSDVYSLGCVLFELLTGTKAFDTGNPVEAIAKHLHDDRHYVRKSLAASEAPPALQQIILKCVERHPEARYQSLSEVDQDLGAYLVGVPLPFAGKSNASAILLGALICLLGIMIYGFLSYIPQSAPTPPPANTAPVPSGTITIRNRVTHQPIFVDNNAINMKMALKHASQQKKSLFQADLRHADLAQLQLENGLDLRSADVSGATLTQAQLKSVDFSGANLTNCNLGQAQLDGCNLDGAFVSDSYLVQTQFSLGSSCVKSNFSRCKIGQAKFDHVNCTDANFNGADLTQTSFKWAQLEGVQFSETRLVQTDFEYAKLANAHFYQVRPTQVRGRYADLLNTGLRCDEHGFLTW